MTDMQRFLIRVLCFGAIQAALAAVVLHVNRIETENTYMAASADKHIRLASTKPPRIIFVGGSSVAFGVDSTIVADSIPYQPVNMGLNLDLGIEYMLSEIEPHISRGDVVVIMLEYPQFTKDRFSSVMWAYTALHRPGCLTELGLGQVATLLDTGLGPIGRLTKGCGNCLRGRSNPPAHPYTRRSFNKYGDVTAHHAMSRPGPLVAASFTYDPDYVSKVICRLNRFDRHCRRRGAQVLLYCPPLHPVFYTGCRTEIMLIHRDLVEGLTFPVMADPVEVIHQEGEFFDTTSHLTYAGKVKRTRHFLAKFAEAVAKDAKPQGSRKHGED